MRPTLWIACGALLAGLAVAAGAFGAHGFKSRLKANTSLSSDEVTYRLDIFEKAARYHMYHAIGIVAVGLAARQRATACSNCSGTLFVVGIAVFSGCLYAMALGAPRDLGKVVPWGGGAFIAGWICLAVAALRSGSDS